MVKVDGDSNFSSVVLGAFAAGLADRSGSLRDELLQSSLNLSLFETGSDDSDGLGSERLGELSDVRQTDGLDGGGVERVSETRSEGELVGSLKSDDGRGGRGRGGLERGGVDDGLAVLVGEESRGKGAVEGVGKELPVDLPTPKATARIERQ